MSKIYNLYSQQTTVSVLPKQVSGYRLKVFPSFFELLNMRFDLALLYFLAKLCNHANLEYFEELLCLPPIETFKTISIERDEILEQINDCVVMYCRTRGLPPKLVLLGRPQYQEIGESFYMHEMGGYAMQYRDGIDMVKKVFGVDVLLIKDIDGVVVLGEEELKKIASNRI